jgi:cell division septum initiation protein DivIVA
MDSTVQIQLPNPQQHIYNSQSFQQMPSGGGSRSSFFTLKNVSIASLFFIVVVGAGMGVMSIKNATDSYNKKISRRSQEISEILEEANSDASFRVVGKANAKYDNPFEEETSYQNPFEEDENPFDE